MTLSREHFFKGQKWEPHPDAVRVAVAVDRFMDCDDFIDRYLLRCRELDKTPRSNEWLRWYIDEDAKAKREEKLHQRQHASITDEFGVPHSWHV